MYAAITTTAMIETVGFVLAVPDFRVMEIPVFEQKRTRCAFFGAVFLVRVFCYRFL